MKTSFLSYFFFLPSSSAEQGITWRGGWPFPPRLSGALSSPPCLSIIPGSQYLHEFSPALCHSIVPSILPSPWRGVRCGAFALCQSASSLQSSRLPSSTQIGLLWFVVFFLIVFLRNLFNYFLFFTEDIKLVFFVLFCLLALSPPPPPPPSFWGIFLFFQVSIKRAQTRREKIWGPVSCSPSNQYSRRS